MRTKPRHLNLIAAVILAAALALPLQIMALYGNSPGEIAAIAAKLSPLNWLVLFSCPIVAVLVYRASPLLIAAVPLLGALVVYNDWFVGQVGTDYSPWVTTAASILFCSALASIFTADVRKCLLNPKLRWWLAAERRAVSVPLRLRVLGTHSKMGRVEFYAATFDISESGAFVPFGSEKGEVRELRPTASRSLGAASASSSGSSSGSFGSSSGSFGSTLRALQPGTQCYICLNLGEVVLIHCRAEIVRVAEPTGKYPSGVGIRFLGLTPRETRIIASFIEDLDEEQQAIKKEDDSDRLAA